MEVRLVQLLASFIRVSAEYSLARLEVAIEEPRTSAPPIIDRLPDASAGSLREHWPRIESQLDQARAFAKQLTVPRGIAESTARGWLRRSVQELDQYARAIRWVLTVTETE